ncbi:MAG: hypothetical protein Q8Q18_01365, partial [bacterium]|nr:hypothetical protein [bacterium]
MAIILATTTFVGGSSFVLANEITLNTAVSPSLSAAVALTEGTYFLPSRIITNLRRLVVSVVSPSVEETSRSVKEKQFRGQDSNQGEAFADAISVADKRIAQLEEEISVMQGAGLSVTTQNFAPSIVQYVRTVEREVLPEGSDYVTTAELQQVRNALLAEIYAQEGSGNSQRIDAVQHTLALTNRIDQLTDVLLVRPTIQGGVYNFTDADIPNNITVSSSGITGALTLTEVATSTFAGGINLTSGCFAIGGTCLQDSLTFTGLTDTQSSLTANRIIFTNSGGTALSDDSLFLFNGTNLAIGTTSL